MCQDCESVWLPGQDTGQDTDMYLGELLGDAPMEIQGSLIERMLIMLRDGFVLDRGEPEEGAAVG